LSGLRGQEALHGGEEQAQKDTDHGGILIGGWTKRS
jgi:hypothetical protein